MLIRFNKPYGVLSQFTPEGRWQGLKDFIDLPGIMTGQILAGVDPLEAIKSQILLMFLLAGASGVSSISPPRLK